MKFIMLLVSATFFFSCGSGLPTEEMAFKKFTEQQSKFPGNNGLFDYTDFKKINAVKGNMFGVEFYEMEYSVKKIAAQDLHEFKYSYSSTSSFCPDTSKFFINKGDITMANNPYYKAPQFLKAYKKAELVEELKNKKLHFEKSENGWK